MSFFHRNWKLHLYLNGVYVGKVKIKPNEKPNENVYILHCWFKKQIFKSNHIRAIVHPTNFLYIDENKKQVHYSFVFEEGVEE
jgi:hypothetical protein